MKIASWNVQNGNTVKRVGQLREHCDIQIAAFQETTFAPDDDTAAGGNTHWVGAESTKGKGVSLWSVYDFHIEPAAGECSDSLAAHFPNTPMGPLNVLVLWGQKNPNYAADILNTLDVYDSFIRRHPTIILGDMNISASLSGAAKRFHTVNNHLQNHLNMQSVYHHLTGEAFGAETAASYYHQWAETAPFHIDYIYASPALLQRAQQVRIPNYAAFSSSDHRPIMCDFV